MSEDDFHPPAGSISGIEIADIAAVRDRHGPPAFSIARRRSFHLIGLVDHGSARQTIGDTSRLVTAGSVFWVRPGQVEQLSDVNRLAGTFVMFEDGVVGRSVQTAASARTHGQVCWLPATESLARLRAATAHLRLAYREANASRHVLDQSAVRLVLAGLLLGLPELPQAAPDPFGADSVFGRFRDVVEARFRHTRTVAELARDIGYSERTVSRAVMSVTGLTAKQFVDRRVIREAEHLLANNMSIGTTADHLGFSDRANFSKFFRHRTGVPPGEFRSHPDTTTTTDTVERLDLSDVI